jgi:hypothetical protein
MNVGFLEPGHESYWHNDLSPSGRKDPNQSETENTIPGRGLRGDAKLLFVDEKINTINVNTTIRVY